MHIRFWIVLCLFFCMHVICANIDRLTLVDDVRLVLPENAISLAYNKMGNQSFSMYNRIFGVQFHPEFNREISQKYLDVRLELGADYSSRKVEDSNKSNKIINNFFQLYKEAIYK